MAAPPRGIHAVQVEIDRSLYLAADRRGIGPGATGIAALLATMAAALADELAGGSPAIAAE